MPEQAAPEGRGGAAPRNAHANRAAAAAQAGRAPRELAAWELRQQDEDLRALLHNLGGEIRDEGVPPELLSAARHLRTGAAG